MSICFAVQNAIYLPIGKNDIAASQLRYDINPPRPQAYRVRQHISHRLSGISQILQGIYIAANNKTATQLGGSFIVSN